MNTTLIISINWESYTHDPILAGFEECNQKLKFAVWELMEYLGEMIEYDDPSDIVQLVRNSTAESILTYSPMDESFDEYYDCEGESEDE